MKKEIATAITALLLFALPFALSASADYEWAEDGVNYCIQNGIIEGDENGDLDLGGNLTGAQMAKILCTAFDLGESSVSDFGVGRAHWAYHYITSVAPYIKNAADFSADEPVTREVFAAALVQSYGLTESNIRNPGILTYNFSDSDSVGSDYVKLLSIAVERGFLKGREDGTICPKDHLTRAEICVLIKRVKEGVSDPLELGVKQSLTPLTGSSVVSLEQAKAWAAEKGAAQIYIDAADYYWYYGDLFGIRADILYAQAGKETGYGHYGGAVTADMNNWAGIKKYGATGDATEDHESFATADDGVRAHFNHMSAYIGIAPIGEVHGRYYSVASLSWAGTIRFLEELGGRWCPDLYYGYSILHDYLEAMMSY